MENTNALNERAGNFAGGADQRREMEGRAADAAWDAYDRNLSYPAVNGEKDAPIPALGRDAILSLIGNDRAAEFIDCRPQWRGGVWLRVMTGAERDRFEFNMARAQNDANAMDNFRAKTLVNCICDERGNLLFTPDDIAKVGQLNGVVLVKLWNECIRINGMDAKGSADAITKSQEAAG